LRLGFKKDPWGFEMASKKSAGPKRRKVESPAKKKKPKFRVVAKGVSRPRPKKPSKPLKVIRTVLEMKRVSQELRARHRKIALVPTMGYLHEGHLSLMREAHRYASVLVVSIFVNPTQFGPSEDLDRYPRDLHGDRKKIQAERADILFIPEAAEMYPEGFQTFLDVTEVTRDFCGASRPGHFRGVATVVGKLFNIIRPDVALFGEKDFQQLITIKRMVRDLNLDVQVLGLPTVREEDGLAMSSRNSYLSPAQRQQATALFRGLRKAKKLCESGERDSAELTATVLDLLREEQGITIEYVAVCDPNTLERIPQVENDAILIVAAQIGTTRLIDNIRLGTRRRK
jgi:pantoate--beta-alanine ligase